MRLCHESSKGVALLLIFCRKINRKDADTEEDLGKDGINARSSIMFDCLFHKAKRKKISSQRNVRFITSYVTK